MPGEGKSSRCGWEVLTSGRRERREEGPRTLPRWPSWYLADWSWFTSRERSRGGMLSWLNLMTGGAEGEDLLNTRTLGHLTTEHCLLV